MPPPSLKTRRWADWHHMGESGVSVIRQTVCGPTTHAAADAIWAVEPVRIPLSADGACRLCRGMSLIAAWLALAF